MVNHHVLVLNKIYQPINVTTVRRAFCLLYQGSARAIDQQFQTFDFESWSALEADGYDTVSTIRQKIRVPRVILLAAYDQIPRGRVRFSRYNIYLRDGGRCQYCGRQLKRSEINIDHVIPRSAGGTTTWENVVCCCVSCNLRKGGRTPREANMSLIRKPRRPHWTPFFRLPGKRVTYEEWLPYLNLADISYGKVKLDAGFVE